MPEMKPRLTSFLEGRNDSKHLIPTAKEKENSLKWLVERFNGSKKSRHVYVLSGLKTFKFSQEPHVYIAREGEDGRALSLDWTRIGQDLKVGMTRARPSHELIEKALKIKHEKNPILIKGSSTTYVDLNSDRSLPRSITSIR